MIGFHVTFENVRDVFFEALYIATF